MKPISGLTQHTVVVCVSKRERSVLLQALLAKAGFKVSLALNVYDSLKLISQEMPHLIITDSQLSDGTAAMLFDRLQEQALLKKIPIMVNILKKTRDVLEPLAKRKFAGFFVGQLEPRTFVSKVSQLLESSSQVSPYYFDASEFEFKTDLTLSVEATVLGLKGDHVVCQSPIEVDPGASLLCVPQKQGFGPALLRMASNIPEGDQFFNIYPVGRISGSGRKWIGGLTQMEESAEEESRCLLYSDPNESRYQQFKGILQGYNIEAVYAKNLRTAAAMLKSDPQSYGAVYLHELMNDGSGIAWKEVYQKISDDQKPPTLVGTTSQNTRNTQFVKFIKRPFGLGIFVETVEACFSRANQLAEGKEHTKSKGGTIAVSYQSPAKLAGLDEVGGIIQLRYPIVAGSRISIENEALKEIWDGNTQVRITSSLAVPGRPDVYQARFEALAAGGSKMKYWEKLSKALEELLSRGSAAA